MALSPKWEKGHCDMRGEVQGKWIRSRKERKTGREHKNSITVKKMRTKVTQDLV